MKWKSSALAPTLICAGVGFAVCVIEGLRDAFPNFNFVQRLEWITYDWRMRQAAGHAPSIATNLGLVAMTDGSIEALLDGTLPYQFGLYWPRQIYAKLIHELNDQGARAIGFDVLFADLRPDHAALVFSNRLVSSDQFLAEELQRAGNVVLAGVHGILPHDLFRTNAWATADIIAAREADGILRRAQAYSDAYVWHPLIHAGVRILGWDLGRAKVSSGQVLIPVLDGTQYVLNLDEHERFDVAALERELTGEESNAPPRFERAFTRTRLWQMGIQLAARELNLDLERAEIDLAEGRIVLPSARGESRTIPVDRRGYFLIDWNITPSNPLLTKEAVESLLLQHEARQQGIEEGIENRWKDKLVVVGSTATGNDLTDIGATPLERETFLASKHWNIANSVLLNRFVRPLDLHWRILLILFFGALAGLATWKLRTLGAVAAVLSLSGAYLCLATWSFVEARLWLPVITPIAGALLTTHVSMITYLVRVERRERRRTKEVFSKIVSPDIVRELLDAEKLSLEGARRQVTVFFADVRGFTEMTDIVQQRAEAQVAAQHLTAADADRYFDREAEEILRTVNLYLTIVADQIKKFGGTLDKYIGDCVMAFWGAPVPNARHAADCVRAVIEAQRAIHQLNEQRRAENRQREEENARRLSRGEPPLPMLSQLSLGSGINTGVVTVGLMGSSEHLLNYTVFGREVNLASRLESVSGRGRIVIGEATYRCLQRDAPDLASVCVEQPPLHLKGFRSAVRAFEVPWQTDTAAPAESPAAAAIGSSDPCL